MKLIKSIAPASVASYDTKMSEAITQSEYRAFQQAYDFFNVKLFAETLPPVLVTLQRRAKTRGYFSPERFQGRVEQTAVHELALNPDHFTNRTDEQILSTLVHEMVHVWQQTHGTPPRRCYHDREWAAKMKEVGLQPSDTGEPGGKETGQKVTHYILPEGRYAAAYGELQQSGFCLRWQSQPEPEAAAKAKQASKTKYTCPNCETNAWAKPDTQLICGACYDETGDIILLQAEPERPADPVPRPQAPETLSR